MFRPYMHVERFGNDEVQGIELGGCHVFPKLDGTNASVWLDDDGVVAAGSRRRTLSIENDNAGFYSWVESDDSPDFGGFLAFHGSLRLYGEWLVPHSLRTYRENAWRRFYVFDVYNDETGHYEPYDFYKPILEEFNIDYIPPLCVMNNATYENLLVELDNNGFLIQDGQGAGEGIVIKNYNFSNRFGHTVWAKIVTNSFKEKNTKTMGATIKNMKKMVENLIAQEYVTKHLVDKTYAKIVNKNEGWNSKYVPQLLGRVYYDLVNEETWGIIKKFKNPTIDFKKLHQLTILRIKEIKPELF